MAQVEEILKQSFPHLIVGMIFKEYKEIQEIKVRYNVKYSKNDYEMCTYEQFENLVNFWNTKNNK